MPEVTYREATVQDTALVLDFIKAIAEYEKMLDQVVATEELIREYVFEKQRAEVIFVLEDGKEVGFALYFYNFSTFMGRSGLYLEDVFVKPEYRGRGYGKGLIMQLVRIAAEKGCGRMEWTCLNWNKPSIDFYLSLGAVPMSDWTVYRLTKDKILELAGK